MPSTLPRQVTPVQDVLFQPLEDEAVLLHLQTEQYFSLDRVGARMWQLCDTHRDIDTVIAHLLAAYDVEEEVLRRDLAELIGQWSVAGLITTEV